MQHDAGAVVRLVDLDAVAAPRDAECGPPDLGRDAVLAARELLAVAAVADARARLGLWVCERDGVADGAAVAAPGEGCHFFFSYLVGNIYQNGKYLGR